MNRRSILKSVAALPTVPVHNLGSLSKEQKTSFLLNDEFSVQMIVSAHLSSKSAESWRVSWHDRAFESLGEWYLQSTEDRALPQSLEALPGSMQFHTYVWGEAGEDGILLIGAFRRDHMACVIRIKNDREQEMLMLAEFFANQRIPEQWELLWNDVQLKAFIPTTESLGMPVELEESFWP